MTYYELIKDAEHKLNSNKITLGEYEEMIKPLKREIEQQPCGDCVKRKDVKSGMIKYGFLAPDMTVTEFVEQLPPVTPTSDASVLDEIIAKIEQARDKDKIAEYPYNRCIRIVEEYKK
jgi:hypothetical protein